MKIDMVYLWCDGNDPEFKARKDEYMGITQASSAENVSGNVRFFDNDELKYALRSCEKFAPWINHVYIVTDRQIPKWLNTNYEKVTVVDHSEIMPQECIPCFNSNVIEYYVPFIPNLSEKFLFGNDDTFFGAAVTPDDFFEGNKPVLRFVKHSFWLKNILNKLRNRKNVSSMEKAAKLLESEYGKVERFGTHHNIDAYIKSSCLKTWEKYKKEFSETSIYRFRNNKCIHRIIFALDAYYSGNAVIKFVPSFDGLAKIFVSLQRKEAFSYFGKEYHINKVKHVLKHNNVKLFCLNASEKATKEIKQNAKSFMEELFPESSKFELR